MRVFAPAVAVILSLGLSVSLSLGQPGAQAAPLASRADRTAAETQSLERAVEHVTPAQSVSARAVGYLCQLHVAYSQRWVPPIVFIAYDPESGRVVISDPIALYHNAGLPVLGKVASETTARISFTWEYPVGQNSQQTRRMLYRAGIDKLHGKVTVTAIPAGFDVIFQGDGRCESQPLKELAAQP